MGRSICAAVSEETALGLSLAGISDILVHNATMDHDKIRNWFRQKISERVGLVVLSKECSEILSRELFDQRVSGEMLPITVVIPGEEEDKRAADLIKRAIGMDPTRT